MEQTNEQMVNTLLYGKEGCVESLDDFYELFSYFTAGRALKGDSERLTAMLEKFNAKAREAISIVEKNEQDYFYNLYGERVRSVLPKGVKTVSDVEAMNL